MDMIRAGQTNPRKTIHACWVLIEADRQDVEARLAYLKRLERERARRERAGAGPAR